MQDGEDNGTTDSDTPRADHNRKIEHAWKHFSYASVGLEMAVATVIGWGFGYWLDRRFGTYPLLMLIFLLLGVTAGFRALIRAGEQAKRDARESK